MSHPPSPNTPDAAADPAQAGAEEPCHLEARYCPIWLPFARGDLQRDIIDMLKPVDDDRIKEGMPDTEFNRKYPPDAWCEEAAPNARVWKICRDEATASDRDMLESWNKTLDVLLIFAGLFSAVSTAFLVESYKTLQPDYSQYVATFLYSAAVAYNRSGNALPPLDTIQSPEGSFQRTTIERWINGLWFISLTISLLVALLSILIKQWLDEYRTRVSRSAPDHAQWTRRRTLYHDGLRSWGVPVMISFLPLLLHISLFVFLGGLVLFLQTLDPVIARAVLILLALLLALYILSMALPVFYLHCPSKTPVLTHVLRPCWAFVASLARLASHTTIPSLRRVSPFVTALIFAHENKELLAIEDATDELDASALSELLDCSHDPDVLAVVAEALGEFSDDSLHLFRQDYPEAYTRIRRSLQQALDLSPEAHRPASPYELTSYARSRRTELVLANTSARPSFRRYYGILTLPDLRAALGIEGALLSTLEDWEPTFTRSCGIRNLVAALRSMDWIPASQYPGEPGAELPPRCCLRLQFCLLFLETTARIVELWEDEGGDRPLSYSPHFYSLVMLVFCAARFSSQSYSYEGKYAAQCLATVVHTRRGNTHDSASTSSASIDIDEDAFQEAARTGSRGIDALYTLLSHVDEYNVHPDVADIVAPYALSLVADSSSSWEDRQGLSDFILSDGFEQYTTSVEEVAKYAEALSRVSLGDVSCGPQRTNDLLLCASVLASRAASLNFSPAQDYSGLRGSLEGIFGHLYNHPRADNEVVILSHFLSDTTVLERWMDIFWHCFEDLLPFPTHVLQTRTELAGGLACALRRRSRLKLEVKLEWIHTLFSNQILVRIAESAVRFGATEDPTNSNGFSGAAFGVVKSFLRHWRHLSPSSWSSLCDHLHNSRDESGLAEEDIERFRNGLLPGDIDGSLDIDCDSDCDCMQPYAIDSKPPLAEATRLSAEGGWRDRWGQRIKHWRPWTVRTPPSNAGQEAHELSAAV